MADDDTWGCIILAGAVLLGGWWLYNNYEIKKREPEPVAEPPPAVYRPSGRIEVTRTEGGSIWRLDADSVTGPRTARQAWIIADHSEDRTMAARETKTLYRINCDTTAYRVLSSVAYDKDGHVISSLDAEVFGDEDDYPPPGTLIAAVIESGCAEGFDVPKAPPPPINISISPPAAPLIN